MLESALLQLTSDVKGGSEPALVQKRIHVAHYLQTNPHFVSPVSRHSADLNPTAYLTLSSGIGNEAKKNAALACNLVSSYTQNVFVDL
jgi:hypothetical protein